MGGDRPSVVSYDPGIRSVVALDTGEQIMVSLGRVSVWICALRGRLVRSLVALLGRLGKWHPELGAKMTLLMVPALHKADGSPAFLRGEDGAPLELGVTLLEGITSSLLEYVAHQPGQNDELTGLSVLDGRARLAFRREILRLHTDATKDQLFEASSRFGVYNPQLAPEYLREIIQNPTASDPFCQELEIQLNGPLPSWLCFPPSFWSSLEPLSPPDRDKRFKERMSELGIDLGEIFPHGSLRE